MLHFKRSIPILFVLVLLTSLIPAAAAATERSQVDQQPIERDADTRVPAERQTAERETEERQDTSTPAADRGSSATQLESQFLSLINQYRQSNGLGTLSRNSALDTASRLHSKDMAVNGYFSHTSLDGRSPWTRMAQAGYSCNGAKGENIAAGYSSAQAAFNAWKNSPGHNENMLSPNYNAIGIGVYYDANSPYRYYWTTDFGACR